MKSTPSFEENESRLFAYQAQTVNFIMARFNEFQQFTKSSFEASSFLYFDITSGVLIGHEPGLGKTVISCVLMRRLFEQKAMRFALVVCPKSIVFQWKQHLLDWCQSVSHLVVEGKQAEKTQLFAKAKAYSQLILIISWSNICNYIDDVLKLNPSLVIADESTEIKNTYSGLFQAMKRLDAKAFRVALSGTPIMNNLNELFAVVDFVCPRYFGAEKDFKKFYTDKIQLYRMSGIAADKQRLDTLQRRIATELERIMLRFTKKSIADYIGRKEEVVLWTDMCEYQVEAYRACIAQYESKTTNAFYTVSKLKQIAEAAETYSSKVKIAVGLIRYFQQRQMKTLVFAEFIETLNLLRDALFAELRVSALILTGQTLAKDRMTIVESFQNSKQFQVMLLTSKVGSLGLNLQQAYRVVLMSPNWNPQVEQYAISRAWRLGSDSEVKIYKMCCRRCIDEKIIQRQLFKRELTNVIGGNEAFELGEDVFKVFDQSPTGVEVQSYGGDVGLEVDLQARFPQLNVIFGAILLLNEVLSYAASPEVRPTEEKAGCLDIPEISELRGLAKTQPPDNYQVYQDLEAIFGLSTSGGTTECDAAFPDQRAQRDLPAAEEQDELSMLFSGSRSEDETVCSAEETEYRLRSLLADPDY